MQHGDHSPFKRLDSLLRNTACGLTAWGQKKVGNIRLQIAIANWVILQFDKAREESVVTRGKMVARDAKAVDARFGFS